jgi:tetratricopeptide (TPR) repeat protein
MNPKLLLLCATLALSASACFSQGLPGLAPLGPPQKPETAAPAASLSVEAMNADLKTARAANQEKRFADAQALMLKDVAAKPGQVYLLIELGLAQLGLKQYTEAEATFKSVIPGAPASQQPASSGGYYSTDGKGGTHAGGSLTPVDDPGKTKRDPQVEGIAYSSLGEIYAHLNRTAEAQAAFDQAVKANPAQAALYLSNETVFFFQAGSTAAQLDAANKAIAVDPTRAKLYYFKAQALTTQATVDPKTSKLILPPGCLEAYQKYLDLDPNGQFAPDTKSILAAAGAPMKGTFKPSKK